MPNAPRTKMTAKARAEARRQERSFPVFVEQEIGAVGPGDSDLNPIQAALVMIGEHVARDGEDAQFRFTLPKEAMGHQNDLTFRLQFQVEEVSG